MAGVLELAQLREHDRVAEVQVGRGRVEPELDAQRAARRRAARRARPRGRQSTALRARWTAVRAASEAGSSIRPNANVSPSRGTEPRASRPARRPRSAALPVGSGARRRTAGPVAGHMSDSERDTPPVPGDLATRTPPEGTEPVPAPAQGDGAAANGRARARGSSPAEAPPETRNTEEHLAVPPGEDPYAHHAYGAEAPPEPARRRRRAAAPRAPRRAEPAAARPRRERDDPRPTAGRPSSPWTGRPCCTRTPGRGACGSASCASSASSSSSGSSP